MDRIEDQIEYWRTSANRDWKTALGLFELKRYDSCLFFCHLSLEKMLKAIVVIKTRKKAPQIHDLAELANRSKLELTDEQLINLRLITTFNIQCRYDNVKFNFYKICTRDYTEKHLNISHKLFIWLKSQYPKK